MGLVGLHQYLDRVEELLEARQVGEAIAHCHHILQQEPRHLDTIRLLGRILLEQHNYQDALNVFVQVLRADPEDLIAHAGRGLAYKEEGDYSKAIWHMERAAEIDAYNSSVQVELANLYKVAASVKSEKRDLTLAAMARLHIVTGRYSQAERELQELIKRSPDRYDLKVLLAEALFLDKRIEAAAASSSKILKVLPDCIKPNSILGLAYIQHNEKQSAQKIASKLAPIKRPDKVTLDKESLYGKFLLSLDHMGIPERIMVKELSKPSNGSRSEKSNKKASQAKHRSANKGGIPTWLSAAKDKRDSERDRIEDIDEIDDVILWLKAIAAEEGPLFDSEPNLSSKESGVSTHGGEISRRFDDSTAGYTENESITEDLVDNGGKIRPLPIQATEISEKKKDDLISAVDYEEALPPWLNEVISFTDDLNINEKELDESNVRSKERAVEPTLAGGIMASLLFDNDDSHSLAYPEDKIMTERNEEEQEKSEDETSLSSDEEWLEELSRKTIEELETAQAEGDAGIEELGDIGPEEAIPDWLAEDLQSVEEAGSVGVDPDVQPAADEPLDASLADEGSPETVSAIVSKRVAEVSSQGVTEPEEDLDWLDYLDNEDIQPAEVQEPEVTEATGLSDMGALASEIPEDPDEAIAWLEQLAVEEEGPADPLEGVSFDEPGDTGSSIAGSVNLLKMPADENEAAEWLEEVVATSLSKTPENQHGEMTVIAEADTPQAPMDVATAKAEAERIMSEETEIVSGEGLDTLVSDESSQPADDEDQIPDWLDDLALAANDVEVEGEVTFDSELVSESKEVDEETEIPPTEDDLDWLDSIDLEEEVDAVEDIIEIDATETEIVETVITQKPEMIEKISISSDLEESVTNVEDFAAADRDESGLFSVAETALRDGKIDEAVVNYKVILASKENLPDLIAALESAVDQYKSQPKLKRLLGDAYTENGQLQKALEMYRNALEDI